MRGKYTASYFTRISIVVFVSIMQIIAKEVQENRPPYTDRAARARYMVHKADWGMLGTVSTQPAYLGRPFLNPTSICDGPVDNSTGIPYVYASLLDVSMIDILKNKEITLAISEAEFNLKDCHLTKNSDPESPLCTRLVMFGTMEHISDTAELDFIRKAMFSRHPDMTTWPVEHNFIFLKIQLTDLWIIDFFGGGVTIDMKDYFKAKP